jgi:hypothetical protein
VSGGAPLSAADLGQWLRDASPSLLDARISAVLGHGPRLVDDGATWISFSSGVGHGRLVRALDGSSRTTARRTCDGERMIDDDNDSTTTDQLEVLVRALTDPSLVDRPHQPRG